MPRARNSNDPAAGYIGMAINAALSMGLHQSIADQKVPGAFYNAVHGAELPNSFRTRVLTWLALFNINVQQVILNLGLNKD